MENPEPAAVPTQQTGKIEFDHKAFDHKAMDYRAEMVQLEANYRRKERFIFFLASVIALLAIAICVLAVSKGPQGPAVPGA